MRQFLRYAMVGAVATATHYEALVVCVERAHWSPWLASGYGAFIGAQIGYLGNRWFTFAYRAGIGSSWRRFQALALAGGLLNMAIVAIAVHLGFYYVLAQMVATGIVMLLTFFLNRALTFR